MLQLARRISLIARSDGAAPLRTALETLAAAYGGDSALARSIFAAWLDRDENAALRLGWAREQLRLALQELVERESNADRPQAQTPADLSWLILAGVEAMAHEPAGAAERVDILLGLFG